MEPISEVSDYQEIDDTPSHSGSHGHASAPSVLENHARTYLENAGPRRYPESVHNNTFLRQLGDTPPRRPSLGPGTPSRASHPRARYSNDTSRSSSTIVAVPVPHLGSVARVPRHLQHRRDQQRSSNNSGRSDTSSFSRTALRDISREVRHSIELRPRGYDGSAGGSFPGQQADLEAGTLDIGDIEGGRKKERKHGSWKRCLFSFLECWLGWEDGKVYYGTPTLRPKARPLG